MVHFDSTEKAEGTTESEKYLMQLCEKSFLSLWSYPNLFTDNGKSRCGAGKELCDLFVIFNNNIIIFSDKDILFQETDNIDLAWKRWYKKSIKKSAEQIYGAENWIRKAPDRIFLDEKCNKKFPLNISDFKNLNIFRVAVTKNTLPSAKKYFDKDDSPSFFFKNEFINHDENPEPFQIGIVNENKGFVHIFDEFSLNIIFSELDTVGDFITYLKAKEKLIKTKKLISYAGEEDLLGFYLEEYDFNEDNWPFFEDRQDPDEAVILTRGFWESYCNSERKESFEQLRDISYFWDSLIENFSFHILKGKTYHGEENMISHEKTIRILASENRVARGFLSKSYLDKYEVVEKDRRSSRIMASPSNRELLYVFLYYPILDNKDRDEYREERLQFCHYYALVAKYQYPKYRYIAVIATESGFRINKSEDVLILDLEKFGKKESILANKIMREERVLHDTKDIRLGETFQKKSKLGRNSTCLCGSGKKYKHCCLNG